MKEMNAFEKREALYLAHCQGCNKDCEVCPIWKNDLQFLEEECDRIEEARQKDLEDEYLIQKGLMDIDGNRPCDICGTWTKEYPFCSDECEQRYVEDMKAQGENVDFDMFDDDYIP